MMKSLNSFAKRELLYRTTIITGDHPVLVITPYHRSDCLLMSLQLKKYIMHLSLPKVLSCSSYIIYNTCNIISKLKDWPFHRVNSPLWDPVIRRLPLGVHCEQIWIQTHYTRSEKLESTSRSGILYKISQ